MSLEETIQRILSNRPDLTWQKVIEMIEQKERNAKGFLTRESAARAVASELGIQPSRSMFRRDMSICDLVSGLNDVTVVARVILVNPLKKFVRSDGTEGKARRLLIADKTGQTKTVLWDDKADIQNIENLTSLIVRFSHGYVRLGLDGRPELNIGSKGNLEFAPPDVSKDELPPLTSFFKKIGELTGKERIVNVLGAVGEIFPMSTFKREDGGEGKVRRLELKDESGMVMTVLWNSKVDELSVIRSGTILEVFRAKVRESNDGCLELHVDSSTDTAILNKEPPST